jgi:hypothetical protein
MSSLLEVCVQEKSLTYPINDLSVWIKLFFQKNTYFYFVVF